MFWRTDLDDPLRGSIVKEALAFPAFIGSGLSTLASGFTTMGGAFIGEDLTGKALLEVRLTSEALTFAAAFVGNVFLAGEAGFLMDFFGGAGFFAFALDAGALAGLGRVLPLDEADFFEGSAFFNAAFATISPCSFHEPRAALKIAILRLSPGPKNSRY